MMTRDELEDMAWDEPHVAAEWIIQLRDALDRASDDLAMIGRVENNYLAKSSAERCRGVLRKTTEDLAVAAFAAADGDAHD